MAIFTAVFIASVGRMTGIVGTQLNVQRYAMIFTKDNLDLQCFHMWALLILHFTILKALHFKMYTCSDIWQKENWFNLKRISMGS